MKKLFIVLFLLCISTLSYAQTGTLMMGGGVTAAEGGDSCASPGLIMSAHFEDNSSPSDVTVGTPAGCSATGDTTITLQQNATISSARKIDGTYSLLLDGSFDSGDLSNTNNLDLVSEGRVECFVYVDTWGEGDQIIRLRTDNSNYVIIGMTDALDDIRLFIQHRGGGQTTSTNTIGNGLGRVEDEWFYFEAEWMEGLGESNKLPRN
jgi:hypothetical protein